MDVKKEEILVSYTGLLCKLCVMSPTRKKNLMGIGKPQLQPSLFAVHL